MQNTCVKPQSIRNRHGLSLLESSDRRLEDGLQFKFTVSRE
jgi:hypothetical protein